LGELPPGLGDRRWISREAHENEAERRIDTHGPKAVLGAIETRKGIAHGNAHEAPIVAIAPTVIGAGDRRGASARAVEQARAAVPAHIVEGPDGAVLLAHDEHALRTQLEGLGISCPGDRVHMTDDVASRKA